MNSFGMPHLMASIIEWLVSYAGGIQPGDMGFHRISIRPFPGRGLHWVRASYTSIHGEIGVCWKQMNDGAFSMQVVIPPNTQAAVSLPRRGARPVVIYESGMPIWSKGALKRKVAGNSSAKEEAEYVSLEVGSGAYNFVSVPVNL